MREGRWAKVVAVHPQAHAVDVVLLDSGVQIPMVPVLTPHVSSNSGLLDLPNPTPPASPYSPVQTGKRDVYAAIGYAGGLPFVHGFRVPEGTHMTFADPGRRIDRHGSDVYSTITDTGDMETFHPSGSFVRMGASPEHEDLTGKDFDGLWAIERNTGGQVHYRVLLKSGGAVVADFHMTPQGDVLLTNQGALTAQTQGAVSVTTSSTLTATAQGAVSVTSQASAKLKAPTVTIDSPTTTCTGNLHVQGGLAVDGNTTGAGGATFTGDVVGAGTSLHGHTHKLVKAGTDSSGPPN